MFYNPDECGAVICAFGWALRFVRRRSSLGYSCSAGVAHNKILAKLCCGELFHNTVFFIPKRSIFGSLSYTRGVDTGLHKPNQQTLLPLDATAALLASLDLSRLKGLGAKLGDRVKAELQCDTVGELQHSHKQDENDLSAFI